MAVLGLLAIVAQVASLRCCVCVNDLVAACVLCLNAVQVQQSCSEAVARKAVAAAVSSTLQQSSGMPLAAAIAEVVARTTACAERTVKCVTSLIMQGY